MLSSFLIESCVFWLLLVEYCNCGPHFMDPLTTLVMKVVLEAMQLTQSFIFGPSSQLSMKPPVCYKHNQALAGKLHYYFSVVFSTMCWSLSGCGASSQHRWIKFFLHVYLDRLLVWTSSFCCSPQERNSALNNGPRALFRVL